MNNIVLDLLSQLNDSKIRYAIGGSMMLKLRLFDVVPKDIDIMVNESDFQHVVDLFQSVAEQVSKPSLIPFKTKYFTTLLLEDISIDIMAGFAYEHSEGIYYAIFDSKSVTDWEKIEGVKLPLMSLEEWYVMYLVMNRKNKAEIIDDYWRNQDIDHPYLLERQLSLNLPQSVKKRIYTHLKRKEISIIK